MTVKELLEYLEGVPDDAEVFISDEDALTGVNTYALTEVETHGLQTPGARKMVFLI